MTYRRPSAIRARRRLAPAALLACALATLPHAEPAAAQADCNPRSLAGRAVGGEILNQVLGGLDRIAGAAGGIDNGVSPTPSSAFADCIAPRLNPPSREPVSTDPSPVGSSPPRMPSVGWGDPHLVTHDGLGYGFQGAGDYAYVESADLTVQARHFRLSRSASVSRIRAFAVRFGDDTVVINDPIDRSLIGSAPGLDDVIVVNGIDVPIGLGGWIDLDGAGSFVQRYRGHTYLRAQGRLDLLVSHDGNTFQLALDESLRGAVAGLLGDFDGDARNDLLTAAGDPVTVDDTEALHGRFLDGWLRSGDESLFNSAYDPDVLGAYAPASRLDLGTASAAAREAAVARCIEAGAARGFLLQGCAYDVVFDGDETLLAPLAALQRSAPNAVSAAASSSRATPVTTLSIDARVTPGQPVAEAGRLDASFEVDRYRLSVPPGARRSLVWRAPCSTARTYQVLVTLDPGTSADYSPTCGGGIPLPSGSLALRVYAPGGDTGEYRFDLVEPASTDLGTVALDTRVEGVVGENERLVATLPGSVGDALYVASELTAGCARGWRLIDGDAVVLTGNSVCNDLGRVILGDDAPVRVDFDPSIAGPYAFRVLSVGDAQVTVSGVDRRFRLSVATPGQEAAATFDAVAGERLYIDRDGGVGSGTLVLSDGDGAVLATTTPGQEDLEATVDAGGSYRLTLRPDGSFTGTVAVEVVSVADDTDIVVERGDVFTLTLTTLGQRATASFAVRAGESFTVTRSGTDTVSGIAAIPGILVPDDPDPVAVFGTRTLTAEASGTYRVVLDSSERDDFIGSMSFGLE